MAMVFGISGIIAYSLRGSKIRGKYIFYVTISLFTFILLNKML